MLWNNFSKAAIKEECQPLALFCMCSLSETLQHMQLFTLPECPSPQWVGGDEGHSSQAPCPAPLDSSRTVMGPKYKLSSFCIVSPWTQFHMLTQIGSYMELRLFFRNTNVYKWGLHTQAQLSSQRSSPLTPDTSKVKRNLAHRMSSYLGPHIMST